MSASEYLSTKTEAATQGEPQPGGKHPLKAALYTGLAYSVAVVALVLPFFLAGNHFWALAWTMLHALLLILGFTYYLSVARGTSFTRSYLGDGRHQPGGGGHLLWSGPGGAPLPGGGGVIQAPGPA